MIRARSPSLNSINREVNHPSRRPVPLLLCSATFCRLWVGLVVPPWGRRTMPAIKSISNRKKTWPARSTRFSTTVHSMTSQAVPPWLVGQSYEVALSISLITISHRHPCIWIPLLSAIFKRTQLGKARVRTEKVLRWSRRAAHLTWPRMGPHQPATWFIRPRAKVIWDRRQAGCMTPEMWHADRLQGQTCRRSMTVESMTLKS